MLGQHRPHAIAVLNTRGSVSGQGRAVEAWRLVFEMAVCVDIEAVAYEV